MGFEGYVMDVLSESIIDELERGKRKIIKLKTALMYALDKTRLEEERSIINKLKSLGLEDAVDAWIKMRGL